MPTRHRPAARHCTGKCVVEVATGPTTHAAWGAHLLEQYTPRRTQLMKPEEGPRVGLLAAGACDPRRAVARLPHSAPWTGVVSWLPALDQSWVVGSTRGIGAGRTGAGSRACGTPAGSTEWLATLNCTQTCPCDNRKRYDPQFDSGRLVCVQYRWASRPSTATHARLFCA